MSSSLELHLLDLPFGLPEVLDGVAQPPLLAVELGLQLLDARLHLGRRLLAVLQSVHLGVVQAHLQLRREYKDSRGVQECLKTVYLLGLGIGEDPGRR